MITQKQIDYVTKLHADHAELNNEELTGKVWVRKNKMYWRDRHLVTGEVMYTIVPPSVYEHIE